MVSLIGNGLDDSSKKQLMTAKDPRLTIEL
jgi:hypothetical protein